MAATDGVSPDLDSARKTKSESCVAESDGGNETVAQNNSATDSSEKNTSGHEDVDDLKSLSDAGKYSFSGLVACLLDQLYPKQFDREFVLDTIQSLMTTIELPERSHSALLAVAQGEYKTETHAFVDSLLEEELVQRRPEILLTSLLLVAIKNGKYDSRARFLLENLSWLLRVEMTSVEAIEESLLDALRTQGQPPTEEEKKIAAKKAKHTKIKRGILIGLATVVGGTVIGLTGGLAAPLLAAGVGAVIGTAGGAALGSVAGVAIIGSLFGVAGAGLTGYKMKKRVGGIEEFEFDTLTEGSAMSMTLAISGWVTNTNDGFRRPWLAMDNGKEQYFLKYESKYLQELGGSMDRLYNLMVQSAITESLKYTALSTLLAAVAWPSALLSVASIIDNPWSVCTKRAENAGKQLAAVLMQRQQGHRPISLIGFSLGARVIFFCLQEMAKSPKGQGVVENVYLLGAPVSGKIQEWENFDKVVPGKIVNAYIRNDWMLKFLYRTASVQFRVAGLAPVMWENRHMMNIDLTDVLNGHMDYFKKMDICLEAVGIKTKPRHNAFLTREDTEDSGISSLTSKSDKQPLLGSREASNQNLAAADDSPELLVDLTSGDDKQKSNEPLKSELPYAKLKDLRVSDLAKADSTTGAYSTDSDGSLDKVQVYDKLLEQGSSEDSMTAANRMVVKGQPNVKKIVMESKHTPTARKEKLLGDIETERICASSSDNSDYGLGNTSMDHIGVTPYSNVTPYPNISVDVPPKPLYHEAHTTDSEPTTSSENRDENAIKNRVSAQPDKFGLNE